MDPILPTRHHDPAAAFRWACGLDVLTAKPGNVSLASPGHGMDATMFVASARAAAGPLCRPGAPVGQRIEQAVQASWAAAGCNTNLGIVLLCAPLAAACEGPGDLRAALARVLRGLRVEDAEAAYRAIAQARPGGLGRVPAHDVAEPPRIDLRQAMQAAAGRDRIAQQYAEDYAEVFEQGLAVFLGRLRPPVALASLQAATLDCFMHWLASAPDTHIVRKHGAARAQSVTAQARRLQATVLHRGSKSAAEALSSWDTQLKTAGINPGTSADLTVATAFVAACRVPELVTPLHALAGIG